MSYQSENQVKASFEDVYHAPTPHSYFAEMQSNEYQIAEQAKPYFHSVIDLLREQNGADHPVRMLDLGCSYGVGSALVKYGFSLDKIVDFFAHIAPKEYPQCVETTRDWMENCDSMNELKCVGIDSSVPAIQFAREAGLIDAGIARNFEDGQQPRDDEIKSMEQCNLLTSTGAIGYVGAKTLSVVLAHLGKAARTKHGPYSVVTILRMFDTKPIQRVYNQYGLQFAAVPGVRLAQRAFVDEAEQAGTLKILREQNIDPVGWESEGILYADLFAAAPEKDFDILMARLEETIHPEIENVPVGSIG